MTKAKKRINKLGYTDKAYLEDLYLDSVNRDEMIDFIKTKFPDQYEKVCKLSLYQLKISIYNIIKRFE